MRKSWFRQEACRDTETSHRAKRPRYVDPALQYLGKLNLCDKNFTHPFNEKRFDKYIVGEYNSKVC